MLSRFSSSGMPSAVSTWKSWVLPTRQTAGVPAFITPASTSSFSAAAPAAFGHAESRERARVGLRRVRKTRCRSGWPRASRPRYSRCQGIERCGDRAFLASRTARHASAARRAGWCRKDKSLSRVISAPRAWQRSTSCDAKAPRCPTRRPTESISRLFTGHRRRDLPSRKVIRPGENRATRVAAACEACQQGSRSARWCRRPRGDMSASGGGAPAKPRPGTACWRASPGRLAGRRQFVQPRDGVRGVQIVAHRRQNAGIDAAAIGGADLGIPFSQGAPGATSRFFSVQSIGLR